MLHADGAVTPIGEYGTLLGMTADVSHTDVTVELHPNDVVVFYTDGVTELRRGEEFFGEERLAAAIAGHGRGSARELVDDLEAELRNFEPRFRDDVAILAVRHLGA